MSGSARDLSLAPWRFRSATPSRTTTSASYHRPIDTPSPQAQVWFDRGLVWAYAFNHEEAIRCFERALALDPDLAIARWGIAYAIGPNYNKAWDAFDPVDLAASLARARMELRLAANGRADRRRARPDRRRWPTRFPTDDPDDADALAAGHTAYADAMADAGRRPTPTTSTSRRWPPTPWSTSPHGRCGTPRTGEPAPGSRVVRGQADPRRARWPPTPAGAHPGVLHLYLHAMEMSAHPEDGAARRGPAARAGARRRSSAAHAQPHRRAVRRLPRLGAGQSVAAVRADRRFVERAGPLNFYSLYRAHDLHFVVYSAMFDGQSQIALQAADELAGQLTPELLSIESPPMADWLEAFVPLRVHVLIRFGRWDELIAEPLPDDTDLYCSTTATIHYGRGVAHAAKGQLAQAVAERDAFAAAYARIPDSRYLFNNTSRDILAVGGGHARR